MGSCYVRSRLPSHGNPHACRFPTFLRVPFGGMKESGVGREGGFDSLDFFTEAKNVCVKL